MDKKKQSQREKYHKVFAQIFQTIPGQEEIVKMSEFHRTDKNETNQQQVDQKMIDQKMNGHNMIDQNVNVQKMYYHRIVKAVLSSPFKPMTKLALIALMLLNDSLEFTVSINKLVDTLRIGRTTVIMMLRELKKWDLIVKQSRDGTTISLYKLLNRSESDRSKCDRSKYDLS